VWALSEAEDKESTQLHPKNKILAHKKYALSCRFSPDSRYTADLALLKFLGIVISVIGESNLKWIDVKILLNFYKAESTKKISS
jgi:hypothetical protein